MLDQKRIVELVRQGRSHADLAREYGVSRSRISQICLAHGIRGLTEDGRKALALPEGAITFAHEARSRRLKEYRRVLGIPEPGKLLEIHTTKRMTYKAIATKYGLTRNQVAGYIFRAKKMEKAA